MMSLLLIVPKPLMVPAAKFVRLPPMTDPPSMDTVLALVQAAKTLSVALLLRTAVPIRFGALCNVRVAPVVGDKVAPALMVTTPLIEPPPPNVAPALTCTTPLPVPEPAVLLTSNVPEFTVVAPL